MVIAVNIIAVVVVVVAVAVEDGPQTGAAQPAGFGEISESENRRERDRRKKIFDLYL